MPGIRSKTNISKGALEAAPKLVAIGAFCIGVDQIDKAACNQRGVAVFNDPQQRSVCGGACSRRNHHAAAPYFCFRTNLHAETWNKTATASHEVRGRVLGIVG